jgi:two-component system, chemotaxis family, CheB/CheR fusion protein
MVLSSALQFGGVKSWTATTAEDALDMLPSLPVNLLMVDLALPGMDGWAFLETVRANAALKHIPAVVVSAYLTPTVAQKAIQAGFLACFPKPVDTTSLVRELVSLFN